MHEGGEPHDQNQTINSTNSDQTKSVESAGSAKKPSSDQPTTATEPLTSLQHENLELKNRLLNRINIKPQDLEKIEKYATGHNISLLDYIISQSIVPREALGQAIAQSFEISFVDLEKKPPTKEQIKRIPPEIGQRYRCFVVSEDEH